jgi:cytochrome P450
MMGLSVLNLLTNRKQRAGLVAEPHTAGPLVEELLRYLNIVQFGISSVAKEDVEVGGQLVRADELVVLGLSTANRDPRIFAHPDLPDVDRKAMRHLTFGYGVRQCIGQNVARAELRTVLPQVFARFPNLRLATPFDEVPMNTLGVSYGVNGLMVSW